MRWVVLGLCGLLACDDSAPPTVAGQDAFFEADAVDGAAPRGLDAGLPDATRPSKPDMGRTDAGMLVDAAPDSMIAPADMARLPDIGPAPDAAPEPPGPPPVCRWPVEVLMYHASDQHRLADAFAANPSPCADYYFSLPAPTNDKTTIRPNQLERMRARGPRLHALAEFHWHTWARVPGMTWYEKGVEFRRRMAAAGYDPARGEGWAINELPSGVRDDGGLRENVRNAVRGLHDGPAGARPQKGAVFVINMGHRTQNFARYKPILKAWLERRPFWEDMARYVRWWAQEAYVDPHLVCVPGTTTGARAQQINAFTMHVPRLAAAGPDSANTAQSYLGRAFVPLMGAVWNTDTGYGDTRIPIQQMLHHVSGQVHATRAWAQDHAWPDGRLGFAWDKNDNGAEDMDALAERLASAIRHAYPEGEGGGRAAGACSPNNAFTWCQCSVRGAAFNDGWQAFSRW